MRDLCKEYERKVEGIEKKYERNTKGLCKEKENWVRGKRTNFERNIKDV